MSLSMPILAIFFNLCLLFGQQDVVTEALKLPITVPCLGCICETYSGCNATIGCNRNVCGPLRISRPYWLDAGEPKLHLHETSNDDDDGFQRCVKNPYCAARTVQGYMAKFAQDCNGDGNINCEDFLRIHILGGYGCTASLDAQYEDKYTLCMAMYNV